MDTNKIMGIFITVILATVVVAVVGDSVFRNNTRDTIIDTFSPASVPVGTNATLTGYDPFAMINVSNGTNQELIPATNYTVNFSSPDRTDDYFQMDDNTSYTGTWNIRYTDEQEAYVGGISGTLIILLTLFVAIGILIMIMKKTGLSSNK